MLRVLVRIASKRPFLQGPTTYVIERTYINHSIIQPTLLYLGCDVFINLMITNQAAGAVVHWPESLQVPLYSLRELIQVYILSHVPLVDEYPVDKTKIHHNLFII